MTWNALLTFVRQSVEGTGLGSTEDSRAPCKYNDGQLGEQVTFAKGTVPQAGGAERLYLTLVGALGLAVADENTGCSDPTAIVFWNGEKVYESSTKFATLKPMWRETVMLKLPADPAAQNTLCIELYDRDAATVCGDFLGRVLLEGPGLGGLSVGEKTLAFRLQPDPLKDDNSFVQGALAIQAHGRDPATRYSVPDYVHLTEEIEAAHNVTRAATGVVESVTSVVGRAEQLRVQGHSWDRIVQVLEHENAGRERRGAVADDQNLWWQNERQHRNEVMGVPKFLQPTSLPDEQGRRTVGCMTPFMVDKIGVLDQYDSYFTACRGGTVHLWDVATMQPANPPTVVPPLASNRPSLLDPNREQFISAKLDALQAELQALRVSELRRRADSIGIEEKLIERRLDQARLGAMAKGRKNPGGTAMSLAEEEEEKSRRREEERNTLIRLVLDHVKDSTVPEDELDFAMPTPGILYQHAQPRGISKHRQCWILDAATLQSPEGWSNRKFYRKLQSNLGKSSTGNGAFTALNGMGASGKRQNGATANGANSGAGGEKQSFSMPVACPPSINPVVFICADNTIRLWSRRPARGYKSHAGELEGYWCKERPRAGTQTGHVHLSERGKAQDLAWQLDCIPTCIARAKPGAIAATWQDVEGIWSYVPRVVVGASDGTIRTWQVSWDGEYYSIDQPTAMERSVAKFHDSAVLTCLRATESYLVSGGQDCGVVLGDHHRWQPLWTGREHTEGVTCVDFDVKGKTFVSGGDDRLVALWDVSVGPKPIATLPKSFSAAVTGVSFSDGHPYLLSVAYSNQTVQLWDTRRTPICLQEAVDQSAHVAASAVTDTGKYSASCFDHENHAMICAGTHAVTWQIRPKKPTFWLRYWRHTVRVILVFLRWYVRHRKKKVPTTHSAPVLLIEFLPKLGNILTVDVNGVIRLWDEVASSTEGEPRSYIVEYSAFQTRVGGDTPAIERLSAATVLPIGAGDSAGDLMTASQTGKLAVHTIGVSEMRSLTIGIPQAPERSIDVAFTDGEREEGWDGVPCEVSDMSFTSGLQGAMRNRPVLVLGHDGTVWLCPHQQVEDARGRITLSRPLQLIHSPVPTESLTGLRPPGEGTADSAQKAEDAPVVTTVCAYETKSVGGGPVVLVGCRVRNKAGEAIIRAYERSAVNRPTFTIEPFSTPPQPDPNPQEFGDYRTCMYRYDPELQHTIYLPPEGSESKAEGGGWITPHEDAYQGGLLLVVRADGVMHAVDMHLGTTIQSFAANLGASPVLGVGGWEVNSRLLICGNIDGFARILFVAGGPHQAKRCMKESAVLGERGGVVNVRHTWRAHTAKITQTKVVQHSGDDGPCFCTAAADGSVKLWGLDGSPIAQLGMTSTDKVVKLASKNFAHLVASRRAVAEAKAKDSRVPLARADSLPVGFASYGGGETGLTSLVGKALGQADDAKQRQQLLDAEEEKEKHEPQPPPGGGGGGGGGRKARRAGRIAKMMEYVEAGESGIKDIGRTYRAEAAGRAAASARRDYVNRM